jgi:hypothetical protein
MRGFLSDELDLTVSEACRTKKLDSANVHRTARQYCAQASASVDAEAARAPVVIPRSWAPPRRMHSERAQRSPQHRLRLFCLSCRPGALGIPQMVVCMMQELLRACKSDRYIKIRRWPRPLDWPFSLPKPRKMFQAHGLLWPFLAGR